MDGQGEEDGRHKVDCPKEILDTNAVTATFGGNPLYLELHRA